MGLSPAEDGFMHVCMQGDDLGIHQGAMREAERGDRRQGGPPRLSRAAAMNGEPQVPIVNSPVRNRLFAPDVLSARVQRAGGPADLQVGGYRSPGLAPMRPGE